MLIQARRLTCVIALIAVAPAGWELRVRASSEPAQGFQRPRCPTGWTQYADMQVSFCYPGNWSIQSRTADWVRFMSDVGNYELRYVEPGNSQEVFERAIPLFARERCMGTARTPTPLSTMIDNKRAAIIAENGLRYVLLEHGGAMLMFGACTQFPYTQPGQTFLKNVFELENTIEFASRPTVATRVPSAAGGSDSRIQGVWLSDRGGWAQLSHRFDGTRYLENEVPMGTFSAGNGEISIRYSSGPQVSCRYEIKASATQIWLTRCTGQDFPRLLFR
jgi:hypothetical protein